ncbi:unnamed protein product [Soboliphyme baturini]|uniref:80 kDa MCM3-associated protein n=1 Tax=Soboliphyme baturini TaxID=241478 RepID=A0A183J3L2_9BILA|nr:unnamed protein product [Soboliphyme baturini]
MTVDNRRCVSELKQVCLRTIALSVLKANIHRSNLADVVASEDALKGLNVAPMVRHDLSGYLDKLCFRVHGWSEKHGALFSGRLTRRRQHLNFYLDRIKWNGDTLERDDFLTAKTIVDENGDWPQLQFQFACAYAMRNCLTCFDKVSLRAFRRQLGTHPLYDFWIEYLADQSGKIFERPGLIPKPLVASAFLWAVDNDFVELVRFLKAKISHSQFEYLSMKDWSHVCQRTSNTTVFTYLCKELCQMNSVNTGRITADIFINCVYHILDNDQKSSEYERLIGFFMDHACDKLKHALFHAGCYRALYLALDRKNTKIFHSLMQLVPPSQFVRGINKMNDRLSDLKLSEAKFLTNDFYRFYDPESLPM